MNRDANEVALAIYEAEDLQRITGIGPKFARALYQIGINHYADLLQYTPEQLASLLTQQAKVKVTPERIEADQWLEQARALVVEPATLDFGLHSEEGDTRPLSAAIPTVSPPEWHQYAGFSLFFDYIAHSATKQEWQTRLYHEETGREALLSGTETAIWADWIDKQASLPRPAVEEESGRGETLLWRKGANATDFDLQIIEVTVSASAETEESCDVHIHFVLSGADTIKLTSQRVPYQIELQTLDLAANTINQRLESEITHLQPAISDYNVRRALPLPNPGRYELQTTIYIHSPAERAACYTGPTLNIV
jgi:hypothetical protein